jgi:hypothetical protein
MVSATLICHGHRMVTVLGDDLHLRFSAKDGYRGRDDGLHLLGVEILQQQVNFIAAPAVLVLLVEIEALQG